MRRWSLAAALAACAACKGGDKAPDKQVPPAAPPATAAELDTRCDLLGKTCGDQDKHVAKITGECRDAAKQQVAKGCVAAAVTLSDCYAQQLCGKADKVWSFGDLAVLAERKHLCAAERAAVDACVAK